MGSNMTWAGYWLPNLVQWLLGGGIGAGVSVVVGFLIRRWLRQFAGAAAAAEQSSGTAAITATRTEEAVEILTQALQLEKQSTGSLKDSVDNLLAVVTTQASTDLRLKRLEAFAAGLEADRWARARATVTIPDFLTYQGDPA